MKSTLKSKISKIELKDFDNLILQARLAAKKAGLKKTNIKNLIKKIRKG